MYKIWKKRNKTLLAENMIIYKENLKKSEKTLNLMSKFRKASVHKVSIQKSIVFQCTGNQNAGK